MRKRNFRFSCSYRQDIHRKIELREIFFKNCDQFSKNRKFRDKNSIQTTIFSKQ